MADLVGVSGTVVWLLPILVYLIDYFPVNYYYPEVEPKDTIITKKEYDYIVVGAGSAGSVMAARLVEDKEVKVLVLEAGGQESILSEVPALNSFLQLSSFDWQYRSQPSSTACLAMTDNRCLLPRGKVVGGSSSINYMVYARGNPQDFDEWEARGNLGWGYRSLLPYFIRSETYLGVDADPEYRGKAGPLTVVPALWTTPLGRAFVEAGQEVGYPQVDINAANQTGFTITQGTLRRGSRCSNAKAYLRPVAYRENLHLSLHTMVTQLVVEGGRVVGVQYERRGRYLGLKKGEVRARREVVLCGGAINSPQLLMLSGIGPAQHLRQLGLPVVADLPVGENLQDHVACPLTCTVESQVSAPFKRVQNLPSTLRYTFLGSGPLTSPAVEAIAFINTPLATPDHQYPDVQLLFMPGSPASDEGVHLRHTVGLRSQYWSHYYSKLSHRDHFTILVQVSRPRSRGYIILNSTDPYDHPLIVPNYLSEEEDMSVLLHGISFARALVNTTAFGKYGSREFETYVPGCETLKDDSYWECVARHLTFTIYHYCGTVRMGPASDPTSVVDPSLRVHGVEGIRVVDASVFPTLPSANTNAAVTALAERAAHLIRQHWAEVDRSAAPPSNNTTANDEL